MWKWIRERCSAAGATVRQFVEARQAFDAAGRSPWADLVPGGSRRAERPSRARLEPGSPGGAERSAGAGSVPS